MGGDGGTEVGERYPSTLVDAAQPSEQPRRTQFAHLTSYNPSP